MIVEYSCDCGEYRYLEIQESSCELEYIYEEETPLGYKIAAQCANCGLLVEVSQTVEVIEDPCMAYVVMWAKLSMNGETVAEFAQEMDRTAHYANVLVSSENVNSQDMCELIVQTYTCACGKNVEQYVSTRCHWAYNMFTDSYICENCDATWSSEYEHIEDGCQYTEIYSEIFANKAGEVVYVRTHEETGYNHDYYVANVELYGDSCEDGALITFECVRCGEGMEYETYHHEIFLMGSTMVSEGVLCGDVELVTYSCVCGYETNTEMYWRNGECEFEMVGSSSGESTGDESNDTYECVKCGATYTRQVIDEKMPGDNCQWKSTWREVYYKDGVELFEVSGYGYYESHAYEVYYELMGDSCVDGIRVTALCTDCGYTQDYYRYDHRIDYENAEHEMVSVGQLCGDVERVTCTCMCGREKRVELNWINGECNFQVQGSSGGESEGGEPVPTAPSIEEEYHSVNSAVSQIHGENDKPVENVGEVATCVNCGATRTYYWYEEHASSVSPCEWQRHYRYVYAKDGVELFDQSGFEYYTSHEFQYEYEMMGQTCEDGVRIHGWCVYCDVTVNGTYYYHEIRYDNCQIEYLSQGQLCGDYVRETWSCVCGAEKETSTYWYNGSCDFWHTEGGMNYSVYTCQKCGATRTDRWESVAVPDMGPCQWQNVRISVYEKDGVELFTEIRYEGYYTEHQWYTTYELLGKTCEDGVRVSMVCASCGCFDEYYEYGNHVIDASKTIRETVSVGQLCGDVEMVTYSCVCGMNTRTELEWINGQCKFAHVGWDAKEDCYIYRCENCGAERYERNYHEQVPGAPQCHWQHTWVYTYMLNGNVLFVHSGVNNYYEHHWETSYELVGDSCEDGVSVTEICIYCGQTEQYVRFGHGINWDHYDRQVLTPDDCCSILVRRVYSCTCGKEESTDTVWEYYACEYEHIGSEGNTDYYRCSNCDMTRTETRSMELYPENGDCWWKSTWTTTYTYKGEVLREESGENYYREHQWTYEYELLGESCIDGIHVIRTCAECGESYDYYEYDYHITNENLTVREEVSHGLMCGAVTLTSYTCVCGENRGTSINWSENHCEFYWHETEDGMNGYYACDGCGTIREYFDYYEPIPGGLGCQWQNIWGSVYTNNGVELFRQSYQDTTERHEYRYQYVLMGESCEDGVVVFAECIYCGYSYEYERYYHEIDWNNGLIEDLSQGQMCGNLTRYTYSCPCGENKQVSMEWTDGQCDFQHTGHNGIGEVYTCAGCGTTRTHYQREMLAPDWGDCWWKREWVESYANNGVILFEESGSNGYFQRHEWLPSYELLGETCYDGVQVTHTCAVCGESSGYTHQGGHINNENLTYREVLSSGQLCSDVELVHYFCVCGENSGTYLSWNGKECNFWWDHDGYDEIGYYEVYVCQDCGATRTNRHFNEQVPGGAQCERQNRWENIYEKDGQYLFTYTDINIYYSHPTTYVSSTLLGNTCEDGVLVISQCIYCDYTSEDIEYYHNTRMVASYDLQDYGMCYGYLSVYSCACGQESSANYYSNCSWYHMSGQGDEGQISETCVHCGSTCNWTWNVVEVVDSCTKYIEHTWVITMGDTVISENWTEKRENHRLVANFAPIGGQISCENGYHYTEVCLECGRTIYDHGHYTGHNTHLVDRQIVDLGVNICGYVEKMIYSCPCGENSSVEYQVFGCNFTDHYDKTLDMWVYGCQECGLYKTQEYESELVAGETCDAP